MTTIHKSINVPMIEGLGKMSDKELELYLETQGAKFSVDENNWPAEAPYSPACCGAIARDRDSLVLLFHVRGLDLRATALEDGGPCWEDSCCEFFVSIPGECEYHNFEVNCIGTLLSSKRRNRNESTPLNKEKLLTIRRVHSLPSGKTLDFQGEIYAWSVGLVIPWEILGVDKDCLPPYLRANFYKCADKAAHPHFLSWNPIKTQTPDFHRPEFFGILNLI